MEKLDIRADLDGLAGNGEWPQLAAIDKIESVSVRPWQPAFGKYTPVLYYRAVPGPEVQPDPAPLPGPVAAHQQEDRRDRQA